MVYRRIFPSKIKDRTMQVAETRTTLHFSKKAALSPLKYNKALNFPQSQQLSETRTRLLPLSSEKPQKPPDFRAITLLLLMYYQKRKCTCLKFAYS